MQKVANVIINNSAHAVDKGYYYLCDIPFSIGDWVKIPFGKGNKVVDGIVLSVEEVSETDNLKYVKSVIANVLNPERIELLKWLRERYVCTYYDALKVLLPPGKGYDGAGAKTIIGVTLADGVDALAELEIMSVKKPAWARVLEIVMQVDIISIVDLAQIAGVSRAVINTLVKKQILKTISIKIDRTHTFEKNSKKSAPLKLTPEQQTALECLNEAVDADINKTFLLRGITGSGKTEVYLQCVEHIIASGKQAIVLVPEISLTPQMKERFTSRFGEKVAILHSRLSFGERYDAWQNIKNGKVDLVVGARSAIFAPFQNLGLIVIDEEHEGSYKSEMSPKYDAREVAAFRCEKNNAVLLLASATPSLESAYKAVNGEYELLQIKNRYNLVDLPEARIVDMRYELARGNKSFFSFELQDAIRETLSKKEQIILFMNRRGFSTFVSCRKCGFVASCPECDIALTYHKFNESLSCHYCGYTIPNIRFCPDCGSNSVKYFGVGTQKVEEEIKNLFPDASVLRMDLDTTKTKHAHEDILKKFREEKIDILVGTQMITKGLDFPNVSLVGVLAADMMLYVDDYKATEKTFQLITQVCGRAGRGDIRGKAIIQTYSPSHWVLECAKNQDFKAFYSREIKLRQSMDYPPFKDIVHIVVSSENQNSARTKIFELTENLINNFEENNISTTILGPTPAPIPKIENRYRFRIIIKCRTDDKIRKILKEQISAINKSDCFVSLDINSNNML